MSTSVDNSREEGRLGREGQVLPPPHFFDYTISNPPYQDENRNSCSIRFIKSSFIISKQSLYCAPNLVKTYTNWRKTALDNYLYKVSEYYAKEMFENVIDAYRISLQYYDNQKLHDTIKINNIEVSKKDCYKFLPNNEKELLLYEKIISNKNYTFNINVTPRLLPGGSALYNFRTIEEEPRITFNKKKMNNTDIKFFIRSNEHPTRSKKYYVDCNELLEYYPSTQFKYRTYILKGVTFNQALSHSTIEYYGNINAKIMLNDELSSTTRIITGEFDTLEEVVNHQSYLNSKLVSLLALLHYSLKFIPTLEDYTSNNPLFQDDTILGKSHEYYGLSLDERLCKYFCFSESETDFLLSSELV